MKQSFLEFCKELNNPSFDYQNDIYFKGKKLFKYQAWYKLKHSRTVLNNPLIEIKKVFVK